MKRMELPAGWFVGSCYEGHLKFRGKVWRKVWQSNRKYRLSIGRSGRI